MLLAPGRARRGRGFTAEPPRRAFFIAILERRRADLAPRRCRRLKQGMKSPSFCRTMRSSSRRCLTAEAPRKISDGLPDYAPAAMPARRRRVRAISRGRDAGASIPFYRASTRQCSAARPRPITPSNTPQAAYLRYCHLGRQRLMILRYRLTLI